MKGFAPRSLLAAQGMLAANDSHARDGYHLRVHPSPVLGLPIVPLAVYRIAFKKPAWREDVVWIDSHGTFLTPPFDVSVGNPVYGYLPLPDDGVCGWFSIDGTVAVGGGLPGVPLPAPRRARAGRRVPAAAADRAARAAVVGIPGLKLEAQVVTPRGWATVAARSASPFVVSATPIERVTVSGSGHVASARWIDVRKLPQNIDQVLALLGLPVDVGRRYKAFADDAYAYSLAQATRIAATRRALQEVPWVADPFAAPLWTDAQEGERVAALAADLVADLQVLMDDTARQIDVRSEHAIEQNGAPLPVVSAMSRPLLAGALAAAQDASVARFLGLMSWDDSPPFAKTTAQPDNGLVYHVLGYWEVEEREGEYGVVQPLSPAEQLAWGRTDIFWPVPADTRIFTAKAKLRAELKSRNLTPPPGPLGPVALLSTTLVVLAEDPMPDAPPAPVVDAIRPTEPPWQPATAPEARRRVAIELSGLVPGTGLAFARRSDALPLWLPLNPAEQTWRALIVPGAPADASEPGHGELGDRDAPPVAADYRVAQCDSFGRWSAWAVGEVAAGVRPLPPRPVIEASYTPAQPPEPPTDVPLAGSIRVSVAVPPPASLPPGGHLLAHVRILFDGVEVATAPPGTGATVAGSRPGPLLAPTARRTVTVTAIWVDQAGQSSPASLPTGVSCYDLRPPPQVVLPPGLQYASRADATGHCRAEIVWPVVPGQSRFRVYAAHETALRTQLEDVGENALLAELDALGAPDRAARLRASDVRSLFPRHNFELLTDTPVEASGSTARFEHALSASLAGLSVYRVVALADNNVEAPFAEAPLLPVAVPNSPTPGRPTLELASLDVPMADGRIVPGIRVRITVPPGLRPAVDYRLFRSTEETRDVGRMPQVAVGVLAAPGTPGQAQVHTVLLVGDPAPGVPDPAIVGDYDEALPADIRIWMRYHFRADVRAAPEPGSGLDGVPLLPGDWSGASFPVAVLVLATEPPSAATDLSFRSAQNLLRWKHPDALLGRHAGTYLFDVYRMAPGEREAVLASVAGDAPSEQGGRNPNGSGFFRVKDPNPLPGTRYRVVLSDPLGRPSPIAELTLP